jgi:hypothetical protein
MVMAANGTEGQEKYRRRRDIRTWRKHYSSDRPLHMPNDRACGCYVAAALRAAVLAVLLLLIIWRSL